MTAQTIRGGDPITAVLDRLAVALTTVGWPVARNPDLVLPTVAQSGLVAFIDMPTIEGRTVGGKLSVEIPVHLCVAVHRDVYRLYELIPATIAALAPSNALTPQTLAMGDSGLPGYRLTVPQRINC